MKNARLVSAILVLTINIFSFAIDEPPKLDPTKATAAGVKNFGFELFRALNENRVKDPVAISPMSIAEALILAAHGAQKETQTELQNLFLNSSLLKEGVGLGMLTSGLKNIRNQLQKFAEKSNGAFEYSSANSLWANNNPSVKFEFTRKFRNVAAKDFGAAVNERDFSESETVKEINGWVSKETKEKITELLSKLNPDDVAVILNAVYAKGKFKEHFSFLREGQYRGGEPTKATFMTKKEKMNYYEDRSLKVFSFNAEEQEEGRRPNVMRNQIALDVLVPLKGNLHDLVKTLNGERYSEIVARLTPKHIELTMPAGKVEQQEAAKLKTFLMERPFLLTRSFDDHRAQFGLLGTVADKRNIFINDVLTKTFYEVTPFGFEAAAATAVVFARETSVSPTTFENHLVDSGSVHVIRHIPTGLPLFIVEYDSPVLYSEADLIRLVEEGYENDRYLVAETKGNRIMVSYAADPPVIAFVDENGKIIRVLKKLGR